MSNRIKNGLFHVRPRNFLWIAYAAGRHHAGGGGGCCVAVSVSRWMKYNSDLRAKAVLEAPDEAIKEKQWESALKIFELLREQHWYEPRTKTDTKFAL
ncbi:hypothetical protein NC651_002684 [Populus alba x Populus x berolinensis]|nr:hypothetical protein NC651_002684 [Populus alba x Populus x berolinensis]